MYKQALIKNTYGAALAQRPRDLTEEELEAMEELRRLSAGDGNKGTVTTTTTMAVTTGGGGGDINAAPRSDAMYVPRRGHPTNHNNSSQNNPSSKAQGSPTLSTDDRNCTPHDATAPSPHQQLYTPASQPTDAASTVGPMTEATSTMSWLDDDEEAEILRLMSEEGPWGAPRNPSTNGNGGSGSGGGRKPPALANGAPKFVRGTVRRGGGSGSGGGNNSNNVSRQQRKAEYQQQLHQQQMLQQQREWRDVRGGGGGGGGGSGPKPKSSAPQTPSSSTGGRFDALVRHKQ